MERRIAVSDVQVSSESSHMVENNSNGSISISHRPLEVLLLWRWQHVSCHHPLLFSYSIISVRFNLRKDLRTIMERRIDVPEVQVV